MSDTASPAAPPSPGILAPGAEPPGGGRRWSVIARYLIALGLVAVAIVFAFLASQLVAAPNVTLVFVLPVVIAATRLGFGPSLAAAAGGVLAFDFFFTRPYYSLRIDSASDIWAAGLLLVIAALVSTVAADARRRALASARAAERAEALHELAHLVVVESPPEVMEAATARELGRIFAAPAVVLVQEAGRLEPRGSAGGAQIAPVDVEAAQWSLDNGKPLRGDNYPFETSTFDFWPIRPEGGGGLVLGVGSGSDRDAWPSDPGRYMDLAGAYLAASLRSPATPGRGITS